MLPQLADKSVGEHVTINKLENITIENRYNQKKKKLEIKLQDLKEKRFNCLNKMTTIQNDIKNLITDVDSLENYMKYVDIETRNQKSIENIKKSSLKMSILGKKTEEDIKFAKIAKLQVKSFNLI